MDLGPNEAQQILKRNAREFLEQNCPTSHVRQMEEDALGFDPAIWKQICEFGWTGLLIPEQYGGSGGDLTDMVCLAEEIGRTLLPSPLFASGVLSALTVLEAGSEDQKKAILPGIASGQKIYTLALNEPTGTYEPWGIEARAEKSGNGYAITGTKLYVPFANAADTLIVAARTSAGTGPEGVSLFLVDPKSAGVKVTILDTIGNDHQYIVELNGAQSDEVVGPVGGAWPAIAKAVDNATVFLNGYCIGGAERSLELAVDYSKRRIQFGRPIGSFQALQHKMSKMVTQVTGAQLLSYEVAYQIANGEDAALTIPLAKAASSEAYVFCSIEGCHIFGGNGYIKESDMQLYYRNAKGIEVTLGTPRWHKKRIAQVLAAAPAPEAH